MHTFVHFNFYLTLNDIAENYVYTLKTKNISNTVITLVCTALYFGVIQYLLKGQTVGKKLLKIKVVSTSNKKISMSTYILRSLIVNEILLNTIGVIFLIYSSKKIYTKVDNIVGIILSIVEAIIIFTVLTREDQKGLHDIIFNTKVISTENKKDDKTIEVEAIEQVQVKKNKKSNKK